MSEPFSCRYHHNVPGSNHGSVTFGSLGSPSGTVLATHGPKSAAAIELSAELYMVDMAESVPSVSTVHVPSHRFGSLRDASSSPMSVPPYGLNLPRSFGGSHVRYVNTALWRGASLFRSELRSFHQVTSTASAVPSWRNWTLGAGQWKGHAFGIEHQLARLKYTTDIARVAEQASLLCIRHTIGSRRISPPPEKVYKAFHRTWNDLRGGGWRFWLNGYSS